MLHYWDPTLRPLPLLLNNMLVVIKSIVAVSYSTLGTVTDRILLRLLLNLHYCRLSMLEGFVRSTAGNSNHCITVNHMFLVDIVANNTIITAIVKHSSSLGLPLLSSITLKESVNTNELDPYLD